MGVASGPPSRPTTLGVLADGVASVGEVGGELDLRRKAGVARGSAMGEVGCWDRRLVEGGGNVPLRSTASTVRWKRLNSASAFSRVGSSSMVLESSFTRHC